MEGEEQGWLLQESDVLRQGKEGGVGSGQKAPAVHSGGGEGRILQGTSLRPAQTNKTMNPW